MLGLDRRPRTAFLLSPGPQSGVRMPSSPAPDDGPGRDPDPESHERPFGGVMTNVLVEVDHDKRHGGPGQAQGFFLGAELHRPAEGPPPPLDAGLLPWPVPGR